MFRFLLWILNLVSLLLSGKIGYVARGVVWLMLAWLFIKAASHHNANEAGYTGKAFQFLESASYGSYLLGILGFGLLLWNFQLYQGSFRNIQVIL